MCIHLCDCLFIFLTTLYGLFGLFRRLTNLKAVLGKQVNGLSAGDSLGQYHPVPVTSSADSVSYEDQNYETSPEGDLEMGNTFLSSSSAAASISMSSSSSATDEKEGFHLPGLPGGGLPPSLEWA